MPSVPNFVNQDHTVVEARPALPIWDVNHILAYGQSLANGWEGWPALSTVSRGGSLMLGNSVHPLREHAPHWRPIDTSAFQPLVARVQDASSGALLEPSVVASTPQGGMLLGETVLEGALNFWRDAIGSDPNFAPGRRSLLASACAVGGRTIEQLSHGAQPELFNRLRDCTAIARTTARHAGRSYGVAALLFLQGEQNSWGLDGGTSERFRYAALLRQLYRDFVADIAWETAKQTTAPAMFLSQVGGAYAMDAMDVAQAQLDVALDTPGCYLVGPHYPVTSKGGHLDANGYRWLGAQFGKVMHQVLTLQQKWRPLHPLEAVVRGAELTVAFHVPVPPLRWGRPYAGSMAVDVPDRGFTVIDEDGTVPLAAVLLTGPTQVLLRCQRPCRGQVRLRYADKTNHGGRGCLHDSDATTGLDKYVCDFETGHRPEANIAELVGHPYHLMNWCVGFSLSCTAP